MWWVWILVAGVVAGLAMLAVLGVVLWRKLQAVFDALGALGSQLDRVADLDFPSSP